MIHPLLRTVCKNAETGSTPCPKQCSFCMWWQVCLQRKYEFLKDLGLIKGDTYGEWDG